MTTECKHGDCRRNVRRSGYCATHYKRLRTGKNMDAPIRLMGSPKYNFWKKVDKSGSCWLWTASVSKRGYGQFRYGGAMRQAHRVAYEWSKGEIPEGLQLDHACHVRRCVNPDHLRVADASLNGQNRSGARRDSKSGIRGVYWDKGAKQWRADATLNGQRKFLGNYRSIKDAEEVVISWRRENMPYSIHDQIKDELAA